MQSVSSRIWTRVAVFISYDDNNYATGTSTIIVVLVVGVLYLKTSGYFVKLSTVIPELYTQWLFLVWHR